MLSVCTSWQGFLQQVVYQVSRGYIHHCVVHLPIEKEGKWLKIDGKLRKKYGAQLDKFKRARQKRAGLANYVYLRFGATAVILRSPGAVDTETEDGDVFHSIDEKPLLLPLGLLTYKVGRGAAGKGITAYFEKNCFRDIDALIQETAKLGREALIAEFNKLNGIPAWRGIVQQRFQLLDTAVTAAKRHGVKLNIRDFRIQTKRTTVAVWPT